MNTRESVDPEPNLDEPDVLPVSANRRSQPTPLQIGHRTAWTAASLVAFLPVFVALAWLSTTLETRSSLRLLHFASIPVLIALLKVCFDYARSTTPAPHHGIAWIGGAWVLATSSAHWLTHWLRDEHPPGVAMIADTSLTRAGHGDAFVELFAALVLVSKVASSGLIWAGYVRHLRPVAQATGGREGPVPWAWLTAIVGTAPVDSNLRRARCWYLVPALIPVHVATVGALDLGAAALHVELIAPPAFPAIWRTYAALGVAGFAAAAVGTLWVLAWRARMSKNVSALKHG